MRLNLNRCLFCSSLLSGTIGAVALDALGAPPSAADDPATPRDELRHARDLSRAFRQVAAQVAPSVVSIKAIDRAPYAADFAGGHSPLPRNLRRFVEGMPGSQNADSATLPQRGSEGTGVIYSADGLIVTNNHVVQGADELQVTLHDGRELEAQLVGTDPETDLAVIRVSDRSLTPATFTGGDEIDVGEWVLAIGTPFGLSQTVTAGIISAKNRDSVGLSAFEDYLQTDAAINPGNSGGPLVDLDGHIVGINSAIASEDGRFAGVGFAIPTAMVRSVAVSLSGGDLVKRGFMGVNLDDADEAGAGGVVIVSVVRGGPAARAGLQPGDMVVKFNGAAVTSRVQLMRSIAGCAPDSTVEVEVVRGGTPVRTQVSLSLRPGMGERAPTATDEAAAE